MIPPQASEKSGGRWKIPMSYRGVQTSPHLIVTSEEFPPKSQGEFLLDIEKPPRAVNVWEFPHLIKFAKIPLFWHSGTILVGFEKRIPVQDMVQDLFEKPNFVSSTKWKKKLSPSHEYSQILLGDSHVHWGVTTPLDFLKPISRPSPSHLLKGPKCQAVNCRWNFWGEPGQSQPHGDYVCSSRSSKVDAFVLREKVGAEKCLVETACYKSSSSSLSQQNKTHILDAAYQPFTGNSLKPCSVFP